MSAKPLAPYVPIPAIVTVTPVPELSLTLQERRTVWPPPIVTAEGDAVKLFTFGAGQVDAVTVVCADAVDPQPTFAFNVYVVVDCG